MLVEKLRKDEVKKSKESMKSKKNERGFNKERQYLKPNKIFTTPMNHHDVLIISVK